MGQLRASKLSTKKQGLHKDGNGLYFKVNKNSKSWLYRNELILNNKVRPIKRVIGSYPTMSLDEARVKSIMIKSHYQNGIDYFNKIDEEKLQECANSVVFKKVADKWLAVKKSKSLRQNTINSIQIRLNTHIVPFLGDKAIRQIRQDDLKEICNRMAPEYQYTANRVAALLEEIFSYAKLDGYIESSPAGSLKKLFPAPKTSNNPYLKIDEIQSFLMTLRKAYENRKIDVVTYRMIRLQLFTLARPAEIATLKWSYIDFKERRYTIPASQMKNKHSFTQPLSDTAFDILIAQKELSSQNEYVFPSVRSNGKTPHRNKECANNALKRIGYKGILTAHGLRRTAGNALAELKFERYLIDSALSHLIGNTTSRSYNHFDFYEERKKMLTTWDNYLCKLTSHTLF